MRVVLLLALAGLGCGGEPDRPPAAPEVPVTLGQVRRDSLVETLDAPARVVSLPDGVAQLSAPADAMVREVNTRLGAEVAAGSPVVRLDAPDLVASARSLRAQALAAGQDAERQRQLVAEGIAARRQAEEREASARALAAEAEAAEALLDRTAVRTPLTGVVARLLVRPGQRVAAGETLAEIVDPVRVAVAATVPAAALARLRVGQEGSFQPEGAASEWAVRVESVGAVVDSLSNSATVLLSPARSGPGLRPGLSGQARLRIAVHHAVLIVPAGALVYSGNQPTVYLVGRDSIARARVVTPGVRAGAELEISGDLQAGDRVVVTGGYGLPDSTRVLPQGDASP